MNFMKHIVFFFAIVGMSSFIMEANANIFGKITKKFADIDLLSDKEEKKPEDKPQEVKKNPADDFPAPLFFDARYPKTLKDDTLLYLYNDKSSNENRHIPPIVDLGYVIDTMFNMISNFDNTADILLMIDAIQHRQDININKQDKYGNTLLHYAIRYHNKSIFDKLLATRMINTNICNYAYICPIHLSIYKDDTYEIQNLLMFGADIFHQNDRFEMPIIIAIKLNHRDAVEILAREHKQSGISENMIDYFVYAANEQGYPMLAKSLYAFFKMNKEFE
jgi:hypothetical protein